MNAEENLNISYIQTMVASSHGGYKCTLLTLRIKAKDREKKLLQNWAAAPVKKKKPQGNSIAARENCEVEKENRVHTLEQLACQHHDWKRTTTHPHAKSQSLRGEKTKKAKIVQYAAAWRKRDALSCDAQRVTSRAPSSCPPFFFRGLVLLLQEWHDESKTAVLFSFRDKS